MEKFEAGINTQSKVEMITMYGHVSGTVTTSNNIEKPEAKKLRQERACYAEVEGYVYNFCFILHTYSNLKMELEKEIQD